MKLSTPAFPVKNDADKHYLWIEKGMTLRDYFAAKAMQGLIQDHTQSDERHYKSLANTSYAMADAMLEARK